MKMMFHGWGVHVHGGCFLMLEDGMSLAPKLTWRQARNFGIRHDWLYEAPLCTVTLIIRSAPNNQLCSSATNLAVRFAMSFLSWRVRVWVSFWNRIKSLAVSAYKLLYSNSENCRWLVFHIGRERISRSTHDYPCAVVHTV